ncbi:copper homeostasis protein CutC [Rhizobiaceae bacterium n13]|uniref:PF03932 family protein CutC n=1 Tax=Ferirhizobium litorale TaxID=2927786 RepID=A0AAE3QEA9_9HYPH|nr:copper homeostasis protein CutC [Fererhizobium litorale]MDI7862301.1 copper homeostasis protein CutC [Fererhizobium litorale]MDI7922425.1 copper homeostasis protein CutC [Fererhizobium litorale]
MTAVLLEVCVGDVQGLETAVAAGADRIELCSALAVGGLTPSAGVMALAATKPVPSFAMIRPRAGDFVYSEAELDVMMGDIDAARNAGLPGVVFGANHPDGRLDLASLERLVARSAGLGLTLHRAFDLVPDVEEAIEAAISLGFERILTSGGAKSALQGVEILERAIVHARGRISVMPGSGVTIETIDPLLSRLAVGEVHSSCSSGVPVSDPTVVELGFAPSVERKTDAGLVRELKARLKRG